MTFLSPLDSARLRVASRTSETWRRKNLSNGKWPTTRETWPTTFTRTKMADNDSNHLDQSTNICKRKHSPQFSPNKFRPQALALLSPTAMNIWKSLYKVPWPHPIMQIFFSNRHHIKETPFPFCASSYILEFS
ncbi:Uncharacterized protein Fot_12338 [Forsythia ovata]|uniref:Uncharacterized protein n=1 Tax=Forsythia ovata TaxID=205694 RepID=A0ABD1WQ27_9LAMI